ncbi:MAG: hypothetical protein HXY18_04320 [Bryobacteraceae bacterium]|nr:hypothetical protein [Bryobacteraceae bacterium]
MHGLLAAVGPAVQALDFAAIEKAWIRPPLESRLHYLEGPGFRLFVSRPKDCRRPVRASSPDGSVEVLIDGYLLTDLLPESAGPDEHLSAFAAAVSAGGLAGALKRLTIAMFAMAVHEAREQRLHILSDPLTLVPVYHAPARSGGYLVSTRPPALAESGLIDTEPDYAGIAEWIFTASPLASRTALKSLSFLRPEHILTFDEGEAKMREVSWPEPIFAIEPDESLRPEPAALTEAFQRSCRRHAALGGKVAQLQSAGLDSRFILAHWPSERQTCFTYGVPGSTEVEIARRAAEAARAEFHHVPTPVEDYLEAYDTMFRLNGMGIFYTRYAAAHAAREHGFDTLLDGFYGDVFYGGSFYTDLPGQTLAGRLQSLLTIHRDFRVGPERYDELAEGILARTWIERPLEKFCSPEFIAEVTSRRAEMLDDISQTLRQVRPEGGSVSVLVRNLKMQNRVSRFSGQQGVLCRGHVEIYFPFAGDVEQLRMCLRLPPASISYNRMYVPMYRESAPHLARVVSGHSLLPLKTAPVIQRIFETTLTHLKLMDRWARLSVGGSTSWDTWPAWLTTSHMQAFVERELIQANVSEKSTLQQTFNEIRAGQPVATGVIYHLLPIARWLSMS